MATLAGPALVVLGLAVFVGSYQVSSVGPFDRAQVGGFSVPLLLLSPAAAALAVPLLDDDRLAWRVVGGLALVLGVAMGAFAVTAFDRIGCQPVASRMELVPAAIALGVVVAVGFAASGLGAALLFRARRFGWAVAAGAGGLLGTWIILGAVALATGVFGGYSCAYVPPG